MEAEQYRDLLNRPGWSRYERDVEEQAIIAANSLVHDRWRPGETLEQFAMRISQLQQFIAACQNVKAIPRIALESLEGEQNV